jgi:hypothetical protein
VIYDAVLVARRGMGPDELRLISTRFAAAVRWALFAERASRPLEDIREAVRRDPPDELKGARRTEFMTARTRMRAQLAELEATLFPPDPAPIDG